MLALAIVGLAAAAVAAAWPYLPTARPDGVSLPGRAGWVNRLFVLAGEAEAAGEPDVAAAARSLIATLVAEKDPPKELPSKKRQ